MEIGNFFTSFDFSGIIDKVYFFVGIVLIFIVLGAGVGLVWFLRAKKKKDIEVINIGWWREVSGTERIEPSRMDEVVEIVIPGTTLRIFYCKKRDLWLPRFSRGVKSDLYYVLLTPTQQMVNFTLKSLTKDLKEANLDYDHTDMIWAAENAREFIKRNYKDKSVKWWQAYQGVITIAIYLLIMTFSFVIIIYFMRGIVEDIGTVANTMSEAVKTACQNTATSGVIPA